MRGKKGRGPGGRGPEGGRARGRPDGLLALARRYRLVGQSLLVFGLSIAAFILAYSRLVGGPAFQPVLTFTARVSGFLLSLLGAEVTVNGDLLTSSQFSFIIVSACTGVIPIGIFSSGVLAYPSGIREKLLGVALGAASLYGLNLVRIVSLYYVGVFFPNVFNTAHMLVWQSAVILLALVVWLWWAERWARAPSPA